MIAIIILVIVVYLFLFYNKKECMTDKFKYADVDLNFNQDPSSKSFYFINIKENSIDIPDADALVKKDIYDYKTHYHGDNYNYYGLSS